jgi:hypothetical protein
LTVTERRRPNSTNPPPIHISFAFFLRWSRSIFTTAVFFFGAILLRRLVLSRV